MIVKNGIIYQLLEFGDVEATIDCLVEVFTKSEPLATALDLNIAEFYPFAKLICIQAVEAGLSHIAKDVNTGEVVGFIICQDLIQKEHPDNNQIIDNIVKLRPIISLLKHLEDEYLQGKQIRTGEIIHIFMLGVKENYRNLRIAKNLNIQNLQLAQEKNFTVAICETTGIISQHHVRQLGFQEIVAIEYKDYTYQGLKVFEKITSHTKCILMEKILPL